MVQTNFSWNAPILRISQRNSRCTQRYFSQLFLQLFNKACPYQPTPPPDGLKMEAVKEAAKSLTILRVSSFLDKISADFWTAIATASQIARITGNSNGNHPRRCQNDKWSQLGKIWMAASQHGHCSTTKDAQIVSLWRLQVVAVFWGDLESGEFFK